MSNNRTNSGTHTPTLEHAIIEARPHKVRTRQGYRRVVTRWFEQAGYQTVMASYDAAGNCTICGEAGRCAGVHIKEKS